MANEVEHSFMGLFLICIPSGETSVPVFCPFLNWISCFYLLILQSTLNIQDKVLCWIDDLQIFSPQSILNIQDKVLCWIDDLQIFSLSLWFVFAFVRRFSTLQ